MLGIDNIDEILNLLNDGGVIVYPTDTLWALGCDATNPIAVDKLLKIKRLEHTKGLVLLSNSMEMTKQYTREVPPRIDTLLMYHTRSLTVIYPDGKALAPKVCAPDGSVAIRLTSEPFSNHLIEQFGKPLVATGACIGYEPLPLSFGNISSEIIENVDYIVTFRREEKSSQEVSQIVRLDDQGELIFIRE